jgi:nicotinamide riboside kinase
MEFPLGTDLKAESLKMVLRGAGTASPYHGAPAGKSALVTILAGRLDVYVDDGNGREVQQSFGPGDLVLFQDDFSGVAEGVKTGHRSAVGAEDVLQTATVLNQRFTVLTA